MTPPPVLVIKHGALGDIIIATAAFAAIRRQHPDAHITLLTTKPYAELLAQSPFFDELWIDSKPSWRDRPALQRLRHMLNRERWQWVYDLQTSQRTTCYQWLLQRPWPKISNASRWVSHPRPPVHRGLHALENIRAQLAVTGIDAIGAPDISWLAAEIESLHLPPAPYALLVAGGAAHRPEKRWPADQYASLAQELSQRGLTPLLIGTAAEAPALATICARVPAAVSLCGKTSIAQLASLARLAELAIGNDTGPMHVIASAGCRATVLFSHASDPIRSAPLGQDVRILRAPDLQSLSVDRVLSETLREHA